MRQRVCIETLLCLCILLGVAATPSFAGTVYVPILSDNGVDGTQYVTRVWLTNEGDGPQTVETLFLANGTDGTEGRVEDGEADRTTVPAGGTVVLQVANGPGLLEITAEGAGGGALAINAEIRNTGQNSSKQTHAVAPVVTSDNTAPAGQTLTLQGLRRTAGGVYTNLLLVNLGHDSTECSVKVFKASGQQIAGTALLSLPALSQAQFNDALNLLGEAQVRDVHARIECDQAFFAYLTTYERNGGEVLVVNPSGTGDSSLARPGKDGPSVPGALVFIKNGTFHEPTPDHPNEIFNIPVPKNHSFSKVVVDLDIHNGGWSALDAKGFHSLFWLHRGACCWPKWSGNNFGFVNARGPGLNRVAVQTNVDLPPHEHRNWYRNIPIHEGNTYHVHYEYDGAAGTVSIQVSQGGQLLGEGSDVTTANAVETDGSGFFMIYFGHDHTDEGDQPTYDWRYQNLRVEFFP